MIDWNKPIRVACDNLKEEVFVEAISWEDETEGCFVEIFMYYDPISPNTESSALFWDQYCVDYLTGKPLNFFLPEDFAVINED